MSAALEWTGPWTVAAVEDLPEDELHRRFEILGAGVLTVSPAPTVPHQRAARRLANLLEDAAIAADAGIEALEGVNVILPGDLLTVPDIALVREEFAHTATVRRPAAEVLLVVEIVSTGSRMQDRLVKPKLYAEAGIPHFWRLELEPSPRLHTYTLTDGEYREDASITSGEQRTVDSPFPVTIDPAALPHARIR